jgi:hypothetical protein
VRVVPNGYWAPPPPNAMVVPAGDPRLGGVLCGNCKGTGRVVELLFFDENCPVSVPLSILLTPDVAASDEFVRTIRGKSALHSLPGYLYHTYHVYLHNITTPCLVGGIQRSIVWDSHTIANVYPYIICNDVQQVHFDPSFLQFCPNKSRDLSIPWSMCISLKS